MDFFQKWSKTIVCPECRQKGARKFLIFIKCPAFQCKFYDSRYPFPLENNFLKMRDKKYYLGNFVAGQNALPIKYRNFLGEDNEFIGDKTSLRSKGQYVSIKVEPTGKRISFKKKFIKNLAEVVKAF